MVYNIYHWQNTESVYRWPIIDSRQLICGVPQGSVLGARIYTMYTQMLADVTRRHDVQHHSYADDTQVYVHVRCEDTEDARFTAIVKLQACISDICEWMRATPSS